MPTKGKVVERLTENTTKGRKVTVYCPDCQRDREHIVVVSADMDYSREFCEDTYIASEDNYQVIKCQCGYLSFRHLNWFAEYQDHDSTGHTEILYPKREPDSLPLKRIRHIPPLITEIYEQTMKAYNDGSHTLCAAGLRVIVEGICEVTGVKDGPISIEKKDGSFKEVRSKKLVGKISGLCEKEILTKKSADMLHEHRFLGNDAVHELSQPKQRELRLAIEIIEHILEQIFEIPEKAETLRAIRVRAKK